MRLVLNDRGVDVRLPEVPLKDLKNAETLEDQHRLIVPFTSPLETVPTWQPLPTYVVRTFTTYSAYEDPI